MPSNGRPLEEEEEEEDVFFSLLSEFECYYFFKVLSTDGEQPRSRVKNGHFCWLHYKI
jgi:hypothetical protein